MARNKRKSTNRRRPSGGGGDGTQPNDPNNPNPANIPATTTLTTVNDTGSNTPCRTNNVQDEASDSKDERLDVWSMAGDYFRKRLTVLQNLAMQDEIMTGLSEVLSAFAMHDARFLAEDPNTTEFTFLEQLLVLREFAEKASECEVAVRSICHRLAAVDRMATGGGLWPNTHRILGSAKPALLAAQGALGELAIRFQHEVNITESAARYRGL
ncbi:hypothetical protein MBLNU230_g4882t1 [Neophaeotheca triangularis]